MERNITISIQKCYECLHKKISKKSMKKFPRIHEFKNKGYSQYEKVIKLGIFLMSGNLD